MSFEEGFVWGAATAAYQIEGGGDCRGKCIWDIYAKTPGNVVEQHDGMVACDHYHRMKEDVAMMKRMGLKAYRFSISWPRIMPSGTGEVNEKGLQFYSDLIDELVKNEIEPYITIYHWELPYEIYKKGGWLNPEIVDWFAEYTRCVVEHFSNRVTYWITQNEPQCYIGLGMRSGQHAPGLKLPWNEVWLAAKHSMLAHGKSVMMIRKYAKKPPKVGYAPCGNVSIPLTNSEADIQAAYKDMFEPDIQKTHIVSMFTDPVILGKYPDNAKKLYGEDLPELTAEEIEIMKQPLDFLGMNNYTGHVVRAGENGEIINVSKKIGRPQTAMGWEVQPESIYWCFKFLYKRYGLPMYVTENGMANIDVKSEDGRVYDPQRIDFMSRYLKQLKKAVEEGCPIKGYFHWSLMDNYEWKFGYSRRFGLVYVDYETMERTLKESAYWYRDVIKQNGENL